MIVYSRFSRIHTFHDEYVALDSRDGCKAGAGWPSRARQRGRKGRRLARTVRWDGISATLYILAHPVVGTFARNVARNSKKESCYPTVSVGSIYQEFAVNQMPLSDSCNTAGKRWMLSDVRTCPWLNTG